MTIKLNGESKIEGTVVSYTYDLVQNLKTVTESNNGNVTSYDYDGMRRVTRQSYPNGWVAENEYDSMGRVVKIWDIDPSQKDLKTIKHTYSYDAYGNLLSEYKRGNGQGQAKEDWAYQYDELNRLVQAHEDHGNQTRNYQYDSLGNLTCEWNSNNVVVDYKLNNLNQITTKSDDGWKTWTDYSYDKRGNNTKKVYYKNKKALTVGAYEYDESNRMVKGINDIGEQSIYHFNGLGILATNEWMIKKNAYGYHDVTEAALTTVTAQDGAESEIILDVQNNKKQVKSKKPAEEVAASPELNKTSHVIKDFVIDYNSDAEENLMEYERYDEGLTYRYVYGVDKLGVTAYTIANGSASVTTDAGEIPLYYHMDHMGSSEFLTSDVTQRVTSWTSYDEWGNITHNAVLKCGTRELDLVKTYTGHERDSVLGQYYAKARMYDTADKHGSSKGNKLGDKRFTAVDPVKGNVRNPQSLVQYTYVLNNPLMYVDPLGLMNYFTQTDDLLSGIWSGVTESAKETVDSIRNIPQIPEVAYALATSIYNGDISISQLAKAMVQDGVKDAQYLVNHSNVLIPGRDYTDQAVEKYGEALGKSSVRVAEILLGGSGATAAVLRNTKAGRNILSLAQDSAKNAKKYSSKFVCDDELSTSIYRLQVDLQLFAEKKKVVSPKGLVGHEFEEYLTKTIGGQGSFSKGGRDFDGGLGNRWWEAKSGQYWEMVMDKPKELEKFKSDMGARLQIAKKNGATYELFSNTPIPNEIKQWLSKKGIRYTELLK